MGNLNAVEVGQGSHLCGAAQYGVVFDGELLAPWVRILAARWALGS